ncbi:MAG: alpha-beta hydrolase superfamily lysophospholipase [Sphingobacteriales bacterium]|jgi:alpha-beta hydrolase superfamily lysophospholipase
MSELEKIQLGEVNGNAIFAHVLAPKIVGSWVLVVHGLGEFGTLYQNYFKQLPDTDRVGKIFLDLPGHGSSGGKAGDIRKFREFELAVGMAIDEGFKRFQIRGVIVGHSLGALVTLSYLWKKRPSRLKAAFVLSPWLNLVSQLPWWQRGLIRAVFFLRPSFVVKRTLNGSEPRQELMGPNKGHNRISVRLFLLSAWRGDRLARLIKRFTIPVHFYHGKNDELTSAESTAKFQAKLESPSSLQLLNTSVHELLESNFREEILNHLSEILSSQIEPSTGAETTEI